MRPQLPTAIIGPGKVRMDQTIAGMAEKAAEIVGSSGRAALIKARAVVINQLDTNTTALIIQSASDSFGSNLLEIYSQDQAQRYILVKNEGTAWFSKTVNILNPPGDSEARIVLKPSDGGIYMGDGTHSQDLIMGYDYDSLT